MEDLWVRLQRWATAAGAGSLQLRKPASEEDIALAEGTMDLAFPVDFRDHLLWHDGQKPAPDVSWMPGCGPLQPLSAIVARRQEERIAGARIPIAGTPEWSGPITYLDGQRVVVVLGADDVVELGGSFRAAVEKYVLLCERGALVWDPSQRQVVPAEGRRWNGDPVRVVAKMTP